MEGVRFVARLALLFAVYLVCASCAKFPTGGAAGFTRLTFTFNLAGPINPNYVYVIAIRMLQPAVGTASGLSNPNPGGPTPVIATGSDNGIVGGLPTHYIVYTEQTPNLYQVYRFPLQTEAPNPNDPTTPINLLWPGQYVGDCLPGTGIDPRPIPGSGNPYGTQLGCTIDTSYLAQDLVGSGGPQSIQVIQFNILTMNVTALTSANINNRVMDAIGDQTTDGGPTFSNPIQVNITTGQTVTDQTSGVMELQGDTYPGGRNLPAVDLVSPWSLQVSTP